MKESTLLTNNYIKQFRDAWGIEREELAELLGIKPEEVDALEKGKAEPTIIQLFMMCSLFNTDTHSLYLNTIIKIDQQIGKGRKKILKEKLEKIKSKRIGVAQRKVVSNK